MKHFKIYCGLLLCLLLAFSCSDVHMTLPLSPKGVRGISAYETWKQQVADGAITWDKGRVAVVDYFVYLKGSEGDAGADGMSAYELWREALATAEGITNPHNPEQKWPAASNTLRDYWRYLTGATGTKGSAPYVGTNGHWWIGDQDMGTPARGTRAVPPTLEITTEGSWMINGVDTGKRAPVDGTDGAAAKRPTVTVSDHGTWLMNGEETGMPAVAKDGKPHEIAIGEDRYWYINGKKTDVIAYATDGKDGQPGTDGGSGTGLYELWQAEIAAGTTPDPTNPGSMWAPERNSRADFFDFIAGRRVVPEDNGRPGEIGEPGKEVIIVDGVYNVIAQYSLAKYGEYVRPSDGGVLYRVYNERGELVPDATVRRLPGLDPSKSFTSDAEGQFVIPAEELPSIQSVEERLGSVEVVTPSGETVTSADNTYVPNRMLVKLSFADLGDQMPVQLAKNRKKVETFYSIFRKVSPDDDWTILPTYFSYSASFLVAVVLDKKDINSVDLEYSSWRRYTSHSTVQGVYNISFDRYFRNYYLDERKEQYLSIRLDEPLYGDSLVLDGTVTVPSISYAPVIKAAELRDKRVVGDKTMFGSAAITLDFSNVDFSVFCTGFTRHVSDNGTFYFDPIYLTEDEARATKAIGVKFLVHEEYVDTYYIEGMNFSSANEPVVNLINVYVGSDVEFFPAPGFEYFHIFTDYLSFIEGNVEGEYYFAHSINDIRSGVLATYVEP